MVRISLKPSLDEASKERLWISFTEAPRLTLVQKVKLSLFGAAKIGKFKENPEWIGELSFYAFRCNKHGIVINYKHGFHESLTCPKCLSHSDYVCYLCLEALAKEFGYETCRSKERRKILSNAAAKVGTYAAPHACDNIAKCKCSFEGHFISGTDRGLLCRYCKSSLNAEKEVLSGVCLDCVSKFTNFQSRRARVS